MLQKPLFTCNLEYVVEPANLCVICSSLGALWCSQMMALFESIGSRHTLRVPFGLGCVAYLQDNTDICLYGIYCYV